MANVFPRETSRGEDLAVAVFEDAPVEVVAERRVDADDELVVEVSGVVGGGFAVADFDHSEKVLAVGLAVKTGDGDGETIAEANGVIAEAIAAKERGADVEAGLDVVAVLGLKREGGAVDPGGVDGNDDGVAGDDFGGGWTGIDEEMLRGEGDADGVLGAGGGWADECREDQ